MERDHMRLGYYYTVSGATFTHLHVIPVRLEFLSVFASSEHANVVESSSSMQT